MPCWEQGRTLLMPLVLSVAIVQILTVPIGPLSSGFSGISGGLQILSWCTTATAIESFTDSVTQTGQEIVTTGDQQLDTFLGCRMLLSRGIAKNNQQWPFQQWKQSTWPSV